MGWGVSGGGGGLGKPSRGRARRAAPWKKNFVGTAAARGRRRARAATSSRIRASASRDTHLSHWSASFGSASSTSESERSESSDAVLAGGDEVAAPSELIPLVNLLRATLDVRGRRWFARSPNASTTLAKAPRVFARGSRARRRMCAPERRGRASRSPRATETEPCLGNSFSNVNVRVGHSIFASEIDTEPAEPRTTSYVSSTRGWLHAGPTPRRGRSAAHPAARQRGAAQLQSRVCYPRGHTDARPEPAKPTLDDRERAYASSNRHGVGRDGDGRDQRDDAGDARGTRARRHDDGNRGIARHRARGLRARASSRLPRRPPRPRRRAHRSRGGRRRRRPRGRGPGVRWPGVRARKSKRKRRDGKNTRRASIKVEGAAIEAAKGNATPTIQSASEEAYILFLLGYVVIIFLAGLLLAVSAFGVLPESFDHWVTDTLYPNYSPIVIGFLVFSSIYGLVKTREDPNSASGR